MLSFLLNDEMVATSAAPGTVLLDFIREEARLSGTKDACREGECGSCTVLLGKLREDGSIRYRAIASCLVPLGEADGGHVVTVEGLSAGALTQVQQLIVDHNGSQCGFCTPGFVLSLTGFCLSSLNLSYEEAVDALDGNLCRCTGYVSIRNAARTLCERLAGQPREGLDRVAALVGAGVLPAFFTEVPGKLKELEAARPAHVANRDAVLVAGGTDLYVQKPDQLLETEIDLLSRRKDLDFIRVEDHELRIGAAVTLEDFRLSPDVLRHLPSMKADVVLHSSTILRNMATITGNIVNASPIADMAIILLVLDTRLIMENRDGGVRSRPLAGFYSGYKKYDLAPGEIIREIAIPFPGAARFNFEKVSNRVTLDIAAVNSAMLLRLEPDGTIAELRLSAGGVAPIPLLIAGLETFHGKRPDEATALAVASAARAAVVPIDDIRGTAEYKSLLLEKLVLAHFKKLAPVGAAA